MFEIVLVLVLAAFMVWWTMSGRRRNDAPAAAEQLPPAPAPVASVPPAPAAGAAAASAEDRARNADPR